MSFKQARLYVRPQKIVLSKVCIKMHIFFELLSNILCLIMKKTSYVYPLGKTDGYCRVWGEQTQRHGLFTMGIFSIHED